MEAAALTIRSTSLRPAAAAPAHGNRRAARAAAVPRRSRAPGGRLRALPPELSEILSPKLVPGSPSDTGDVSSLIPVSALMLLFYFVSNWVVPELLMKRLQPKAEDQEASAAASMSFSGDATDGQSDGDDARPKIRLKVIKKQKKKKNRKAPVEV
ncbi:uncharacterized protein LOC120664142 [Panicum virgatum]|uniref:Uncharacterized protein n=1 Tax=Panicum virgatum TaxID=38727 RepID=A0A8T0U2D9_PANVG|nr:uncharacterized protein LOC120664142 [Panicum virgatum]KAG2616168.1 hypothetical protein PVAP13_3NG146350 [Panicum virgatum]